MFYNMFFVISPYGRPLNINSVQPQILFTDIKNRKNHFFTEKHRNALQI